MAKRYTFVQLSFLRKGYKSLDARALTKEFNELFSESKSIRAIYRVLRANKIKTSRRGRNPFGKPLGYERIAEGYIDIKVEKIDSQTGKITRQFVSKHSYLWELANGSVPEDMVVSFIDGDRTHCELENLMLISKAERSILNRFGYRDAPIELKPSILMLAKVKTKAFSMGHTDLEKEK